MPTALRAGSLAGSQWKASAIALTMGSLSAQANHACVSMNIFFLPLWFLCLVVVNPVEHQVDGSDCMAAPCDG
jgi:hypothetical protein